MTLGSDSALNVIIGSSATLTAIFGSVRLYVWYSLAICVLAQS